MSAVLFLVAIFVISFAFLYKVSFKRKDKAVNNFGEVKISSLITYPIKSCAGISVNRIRLTRLGLAYDRVWMFVDCSRGDRNVFITQRQNPKLARIVPRLVNSKGEDDVDAPVSLILTAPGMPTLTVPAVQDKSKDLKSKEVIDVVVWNNDLKATVVSAEADEWITKYLGRKCRFVSIVSFDEHKRKLDPNYDTRENVQTAFADGYPILLGSAASLKPVNEKMEELRKTQSPPSKPSEDEEIQHLPDAPIKIRQFRPNIIISGEKLAPFAEDYWKKIRFEGNDKKSGIECTVVKSCERCILPNVNQDLGVRDQLCRVTAALKAFRDGKTIGGGKSSGVYWGQNLIHSRKSIGSYLQVGDLLQVVSTAKSMVF